MPLVALFPYLNNSINSVNSLDIMTIIPHGAVILKNQCVEFSAQYAYSHFSPHASLFIAAPPQSALNETEYLVGFKPMTPGFRS